jgi:hypothetical protein
VRNAAEGVPYRIVLLISNIKVHQTRDGLYERANRTPLSLGRGAGGEGMRLAALLACACSRVELHALKDGAALQDVPSLLTPLPREKGTGFIDS